MLIRCGAGLVVVVALTSGPNVVHQALASPQHDIDAVRSQVTDLEMRAAGVNENYKQALSQLKQTRQLQSSLRIRLGRERSKLATLEEATDALARAAYMAGGLPPSLHLLIAGDPRELLSQGGRLDAVARVQAASIRRAQAARAAVAQRATALADQGRIADQILDQMRASKQAIDSRLAQARSLLATLQPAQRRQLAAEANGRARQSRAQAGRLARSWASPTARPRGVSSRAMAAVKYALSHVGSPYSLNAHPPTSWDCSKLTAAAWARGGVGLTSLSYAQWNQVQRIPSAQLRPGDLVFYFRGDAHHVALYVGNGKMVSASNPSDGVEVIDYLGPWYAEHYSGAGRVL